MSWSRLALALVAVLALEACGFRPLYGQAGEPAVRRQLQAVEVGVIEGRLGRLLRLDLDKRLSPGAAGGGGQYRLDVALNTRVEKMAYRRDGTPTLERVIVAGDVRLLRPDGGVALADRTTAVTSYDILNEHFAAIVARRDAEDRAVRLLADDIANRLALHFAEQAEREGAAAAPAETGPGSGR